MKFIFIISFLILGACTKKAETPEVKLTGDELIARGQTIYKMNCISCHNPDPSLDGPTGPALKGSSFDLIKMRVTKAQYPDDYKPKRDTKIMPALPHLESEVPALHAFLNSN
jgi:mono/diheme cytochrome c family protein